MLPGTICLPIGLFLTGWTARADVHWIVPDIVSNTPVALLTNAHANLGHRLRRRRHDPQLPGHPDLRHRRVHATRCVRARRRYFPAVVRRVRVPVVCAGDVRFARLRKR